MKEKAIKVLKQFQEKLDSFDDNTFDTLNIEALQGAIDIAISMAEAEIEIDQAKKMLEDINKGLGLQR
jgi:hypothetical protein